MLVLHMFYICNTFTIDVFSHFYRRNEGTLIIEAKQLYYQTTSQPPTVFFKRKEEVKWYENYYEHI